MKKSVFIAIGLAVVLLVSAAFAEEAATEPANEWTAVYTPLLENSESYALMDVNVDGVPEMMVLRGTCEADYTMDVYTMKLGSAVKVGDALPFSHSVLCDLPNTTCFAVQQAAQGVENLTAYELEQGALNEKPLYQDKAYSENEPYLQLKSTELTPSTDLSAMNWTGNPACDNTEVLNTQLESMGIDPIPYM